ncbi:cytochrome P450 [Cyathus striatus]|nr:cytochrome P450 [Cyathus striatus]
MHSTVDILVPDVVYHRHQVPVSGQGFNTGGYDKYPGQVFKVATVGKWVVLATGTQLVNDIRKAKEEQLSALKAINEIISMDDLLSPQLLQDDYHSEVVRTQVTRNLPARYAEIKDEVATAFADLIPVYENEWTEVVAYKMILKSVVRTSNRLLVGLPLCRDPDYVKLQEAFTIDIFKVSTLIHMFPMFLRPFVSRFINVESQLQRAIRHLKPLIEDRIAKIDALGPNYPDKPNDVISWCLEHAKGEQRTVRELAIRVMAINTGAIHTTTMAFTHAIYDLAIHPEYVSEMREEVESIIEEYGWTKESIDKMNKVDSFIKESMRSTIPGAFTMLRKVVSDFTFSNGQVVPSGAYIAVAAYPMHLDDDIYSGGHEFDGFRFSKKGEEGESDTKNKVVSLALDYVAFGHGRHACPGRFFVANEMKTMLAHVLLNYDVKLPTNKRPANLWLEDKQIPNHRAKVLFRKRR